MRKLRSKKQKNNRTIIINYKCTNGGANGIGLDATAENHFEFKQRRNSNSQHKTGQHGKKDYKTTERLQRFILQQ